MGNFFNGVLKFITVVFTIAFVLTVGIALVLFNAEKRLFNPDLYTAVLESQNFYENLPALAAEALSASPQEGEYLSAMQSLLAVIPAENWEAALRVLLPVEVSQPMAEQAIASVFDYLNGKSETATISLTNFKTHMSAPASAQAFVVILRAQPPCTLEQIAEMIFNGLAGNPKLVFCNPSEDALGMMEPLIQSGLQTTAAGIPDSVTLIQPETGGAQNPMNGLRAVRTVMRFSPLVPLGLLFLITIFAVHDLKGWLNWWGIPLLIGGIIGLLLAVAISPLFQWAYAIYVTPRLPSALPESVTTMIRNIVSAVLSGVAAPILFQAFGLVLVGMVMILATRFKRGEQQQQS